MTVDDSVARLVLAQFDLGRKPATLHRLGSHGGFSGARLWRCEKSQASYCLRAWPPEMTKGRLLQIHFFMQKAKHNDEFDIVPSLVTANDLNSWVSFGQRFWELTSWMPGKADYHTNPTPGRLRAACIGLASIHERDTSGMPRQPSPAVERRLSTYWRWQGLVDSGWKPTFFSGLSNEQARRAWDQVNRWAPQVPRWLLPWQNRSLSVQLCLCDVWHDHLLFEGDTLTGLVDYGEVKRDNASVDLARMLGSLIGDDEEKWTAGLKAYRCEIPLTDEEEALARVLDRVGVILGASNWLRWLYHDGRQYDDLAAVERRLGALVQRMEHWGGGLIS